MLQLAIVLSVLALVGTLAMPRGLRANLLLLASLLALVLCLIAQSAPRPVGDSREYIVMAGNLARFERPSATAADLMAVSTSFPEAQGSTIEKPRFRGPDGRQDFPHFWFYSMLAAPFVRTAEAVGASPIIGFAALNVVMLVGLAAFLITLVPPAPLLIVVASPILWWIDKAHPEVLTFSMVAVALAALATAPWWSIAAFGVAATQNPPMAGAMAICMWLAFHRHGWRDRRVWLASAAGLLAAALHPIYFYSRLGLWSGLQDAIDRHWPSWRELMTVAFDPNLGIFIHDPLLLLAMAIALVEAVTRPRWKPQPSDAAAGAIALLFLVSFTQTTNVNHGGTPDPSRYGLWLVPFALPILSGVPESARWLKLVAAGSVAWCVWAFPPLLPDQNLRPTTMAGTLWHRWPALDNPLAEIFAERVGGNELARPPVATARCDKVLLRGDGSGAAWPSSCTAAPLPPFCQVKEALCYANLVDGKYQFVSARATPAWRVGIARENAAPPRGGMLAIKQARQPQIPMAVWQEDGWSYSEQLANPAPDVVDREWRWIGERAGIGVLAGEPVEASLTIMARSLNRPRRLRLSIGDAEIITIVVTTNRTEYQTSAFQIPGGTSVITLESLDDAETPGTGDPRRLSVAIFSIALQVP